jgi:hypothetical protein
VADKFGILQVSTIAWLMKHGCGFQFGNAFLTRIAWVTLALVSGNVEQKERNTLAL